jgi:hypothetical protein
MWVKETISFDLDKVTPDLSCRLSLPSLCLSGKGNFPSLSWRADMGGPHIGQLRFQKLWDSGIGLSAWLVRLSVTDVDAPAVTSESSQAGIVQELKDRLFGRDDCHIVELGNAASSSGFLIMTVVIYDHVGAGTGIVSLVLAALRSASPTSESTSTSNHGTCILSTDLRELSLFFFRDWHL